MSETLNLDFRDLLDCLGSEGAEFLIVGAYAVAFHGTPRATGDLDVFVRPTIENAARVWRALARFGAPLQERGVAESDFAVPGMIYQIGLPPRRIDILTAISGVSFDDAWAFPCADDDGRSLHRIHRPRRTDQKQTRVWPR